MGVAAGVIDHADELAPVALAWGRSACLGLVPSAHTRVAGDVASHLAMMAEAMPEVPRVRLQEPGLGGQGEGVGPTLLRRPPSAASLEERGIQGRDGIPDAGVGPLVQVAVHRGTAHERRRTPTGRSRAGGARPAASHAGRRCRHGVTAPAPG